MTVTLVALACALACAADVPTIDAPVVDRAEVLDKYEESDLAGEVKAVSKDGGPQMAVLLVTTTDGPIEDFANAAANAWGGGAKGKDDGVLLVIATSDRRVRLEVGDGLEAALPDSEAKRLIDAAAPSFRGSRWREGAGIIVNGVASRMELARRGIAPPKEDQTVQGMLFVAAIVAGLVILAMFARAAWARRPRRGNASLPYAGAPKAGDDDLPFKPNLPPEGAGNAFAGQLAREREAFQQDPEAPPGAAAAVLSSTSASLSSSWPASTSSSSSSSSSPSSSSSSSSNTGNKGGGGNFSGGGASGSF